MLISHHIPILLMPKPPLYPPSQVEEAVHAVLSEEAVEAALCFVDFRGTNPKQLGFMDVQQFS
jgi:hypothetical protein